MIKKQADTPETPAEPVQELDPVHKAIATDEYAGQGGSYLYDQATGKRTPITE